MVVWMVLDGGMYLVCIFKGSSQFSTTLKISGWNLKNHPTERNIIFQSSIFWVPNDPENQLI